MLDLGEVKTRGVKWKVRKEEKKSSSLDLAPQCHHSAKSRETFYTGCYPGAMAPGLGAVVPTPSAMAPGRVHNPIWALRRALWRHLSRAEGRI
ncbi:hypothetical protein Scep_013870 [Stephania cephalantha]|uniref:Uncharacterized protein n=1 Tax=Stephania cephalantha TaxID=152367 RepID=A0AAP0J099_9MAGN